MSNTILVAPLNWGLGHATRCIPIIQELQKNGFTPIIASDGVALALLKKEFPDLVVEERSAVSIARRLQDPLSELVKIDPKSIGVGQYQHDVAQKKLSESFNKSK